ncbi:MAG TPA: TPM domain-containing protein, partial [Gaiellaceae bacterium]|nr:TPM domain-containing protein [Gaiellaceae bacterium]
MSGRHQPSTTRARRALAVVVVVGALVAPGAAAQAPPTAVTAPVTDEAAVLSPGEEAEVERTLRETQARGVDLRVLFVDDTGAASVTEYADSVAAASRLSDDDALLVIAFGPRTYAIWAADGLGVSTREIQTILDGAAAPRLRAGDVPGAVEATADGLVRARGGGAGGGGSGAGPVGGIAPLLPLLLLGAGVLFLVFRLRSRSHAPRRGTAGAGAPTRHVDLDALAAEANAALVRVDDELQDAEHEAGFAEAQFGSEEGAALRGGLAQARSELQRAFALRQRLDDHVPEPPHEQAEL